MITCPTFRAQIQMCTQSCRRWGH